MEPKIYGSSRTEVINPKVKLISYSSDSVGTVASMWIGTRYNDTFDPRDLQGIYDMDSGPLPSEYAPVVEKLREMYHEYSELSGREIISKIVSKVDKINLPPLDSVNFTFQVDDTTVTLREQMVRSRLPQNFWTQSTRTADLREFDVSMMETIPDIGGEEAVEIYKETVDTIREAFVKLGKLGVPQEDIRLAPSNMLHRIYWMVPYRTLKSIMKQRISWIAQIGLWGPLIKGIISELRKVPSLDLFAKSLGIPSDVDIKDGKVVAHRNDIDNEARYQGRDPLPVDPLWIAYRQGLGEDISYPKLNNPSQFIAMKRMYLDIWSDEVLEVLGWDKDNLGISGPYDPSI